MPLTSSRLIRSLHKWAAIIISVPIIFIIISGIFLQVRKPVEFIQPSLNFGVAKYQPTVNLNTILESVKTVPEMKVRGWRDVKLLDLRAEQGTVKVRNQEEFEVQVDAKIGAVLGTGQRLNDIVTLMHEGTTWGLRLWVFLPVAVITILMPVSGSYLLIQVTRDKLRSRRPRRVAASQTPAGNVTSLQPAARRRFNPMEFCRKYHYFMGFIVLVPWLIVVTSGLILQVRYEFPWIMPQLQKGSEGAPTLQFTDALNTAKLIPQIGVSDWNDVWRIYVYPNQGVVSIRTKNRWQIQLDAQTGELLDLAVRRTDLLEDIHEGRWMGANLWLFLPVHVLSVFLWLFGVTLWLELTFSSKPRKVDKRSSPVKVTKR